VYAVNLGDRDTAPSCECRGASRFGYCKHVSPTRALLAAGKLEDHP
jgi:hypothetical protein